MNHPLARVRAQRRRVERLTPGELAPLAKPWLRLSSAFGNPGRERLFSPLSNLLALSGAGVGRRPVLPGGGPELCRMVGFGGR
jgi:hypothetical protein